MLDTSKRNAGKLHGPIEDVTLDEKKASETTHLSGIFKPTSDHNIVKDGTILNDCSVIVEVHSLGPGSASNHQDGKSEGIQTKAIGQETQSSQPMGGGDFGGIGHVITGGRHKKSDQSVNEELPSLLPPWKRQILVNRMVKEKALEKVEREKV